MNFGKQNFKEVWSLWVSTHRNSLLIFIQDITMCITLCVMIGDGEYIILYFYFLLRYYWDLKAGQRMMIRSLVLKDTVKAVPITLTCPCNIQQYFKAVKMFIFRWKFLIFFLTFAQNIDCGYTSEPPQ